MTMRNNRCLYLGVADGRVGLPESVAMRGGGLYSSLLVDCRSYLYRMQRGNRADVWMSRLPVAGYSPSSYLTALTGRRVLSVAYVCSFTVTVGGDPFHIGWVVRSKE